MISISRILSELNASPSDLLRDAATNLCALKQRSFLALVGISIGTASIVALLTIGHMAQQEVMKIFQASGINSVVVQFQPASPDKPQKITANTIYEIARQIPGVEASVPMTTGDDVTKINGQRTPFDIAAIPPEAQNVATLKLLAGRYLYTADNNTLDAVIGLGLAKIISPGNPGYALGYLFRINNYRYRVVGIFQKRDNVGIDPLEYNKAIFIPFGDARRTLPASGINTAVIRLYPGQDAENTVDKITKYLSNFTPEDSFDVSSARDFIRTMKAQNAVQIRLLAAIGGVSLLVGGIGVMNVMLMSMMERRREIGIRAAIGATPRDIQLMFLAEAIILAIGGGVLGTLLGIVIAFIVAQTSAWSFSIALYALPLGICLAAVVGIVFGVYPAIKASRQDPIEALHVA